MCEDAGIVLAFLPPYSPDLNPIDETFAQFKAWIKKNKQMVERFQDYGDFLRMVLEVLQQAVKGHFWLLNYWIDLINERIRRLLKYLIASCHIPCHVTCQLSHFLPRHLPAVTVRMPRNSTVASPPLQLASSLASQLASEVARTRIWTRSWLRGICFWLIFK